MRKQEEGRRKLCGTKRKVVGSYVAENGKEDLKPFFKRNTAYYHVKLTGSYGAMCR